MRSQELEAYKWQKRILVLCDKSPDSDALQMQLSAFKERERALEERDLIVFLVFDEGVQDANGDRVSLSADKLRENLNIATDFSGVLLIGKDGGVKLREKFQVHPSTVFKRIDGMPMRRAEMKKSEKS